jgi:hypothetical protein
MMEGGPSVFELGTDFAVQAVMPLQAAEMGLGGTTMPR